MVLELQGLQQQSAVELVGAVEHCKGTGMSWQRPQPDLAGRWLALWVVLVLVVGFAIVESMPPDLRSGAHRGLVEVPLREGPEAQRVHHVEWQDRLELPRVLPIELRGPGSAASVLLLHRDP